ncbi:MULTISPECIES: 2OG-Fe(II)-dependent halogenase WelO5 family protein [unclassified Streptomyces]|uniref:2OG-Fe(II)-dependent halogenase WelO5 family protein n=1 Tax=unclassified Streptomyces TaxID=2593676 RepID=UPI002DD85B73|nr:hypothetical protein [Streptomyces sp. NBC_01294]WRZ56686.1 2OG-Fe(II) oxygenase [Streptomyces sp. NBC_01294]
MTEQWGRIVIDVDRDKNIDGADLVRRLVDGTVAVVVLRNLLPESVFDANRERLAPVFGQASTTQYSNGSLTTIGPYLAKHLDDPDTYFAEALKANEFTESIGVDLGARTRQRLAEVLDLKRFDTESEADGRSYSQQNVRIYADNIRTPLHNDNIMRDAAGTGLALAELRHQLSCVVCIQECEDGGELRIHRKRWSGEDNEYKIVGGLGYDEAVTGDAPAHEFKPRAGDVYLLNPTYYHSIEQVTGSDRITMGFFFGFYDDELTEAVSWI